MTIIEPIEIMVNINGDELTITEDLNGTTLTNETGKARTFKTYEAAVNWAYRHGYIF